MPGLTVERLTTTYKNQSEKFTTKNVEYKKQYCSAYNVRLTQMRGILEEKAKEKWGCDYKITKLHDIAVNNFAKCIIIGTLFKDQKLKPSILKQISEDNLLPLPVYQHFTDDSDVLFIEDELQRFQLLGVLDIKSVVTGISCALLGSDLGNGKFDVEDYCFAEFRAQIERPILEDDCFIIFMSGLDVMHLTENALPFELFANWISGLLNNVDAQKICRIVIAGNSITVKSGNPKPIIAIKQQEEDNTDVIKAARVLDNLLNQWSKVVDVDLMPGEYDTANHILPQQPLHMCMFPQANKYKSFHRVTNPYSFDVNGCKFLGTSGQPVTDILRFSDIESPCTALANCLTWNHIAPTAPDTLGCIPYYDRDPFIVEDCPHVIFAGNQDKFETKVATGNNGQTVRVICVPQFSSVQTVCLLNLKNLDCTPISFKVL